MLSFIAAALALLGAPNPVLPGAGRRTRYRRTMRS